MSSSRTPPGWPQSVPPPESPGWQVPAVSWLLDHCPADFRGYAGWRRNPVALAWVAVRHIDAQLEVMRQAYREVRVDLGDVVSPEALTQIQSDLEAEGLRLRASARVVDRSPRAATCRRRHTGEAQPFSAPSFAPRTK